MPQIDKENYLCVGCGICAHSCPKQCIKFSENILGQYQPFVEYTSCIECKVCEKICPLYCTEEQEKTFQYNVIVGNYLSTYKGFDKKYRKTSASGGFVTGVLAHLLNEGVIDYAVCVKNEPTETSFFRYEYITNPEELISSSKSAYYPLEISSVLKHIKNNEGRYALVVLPCQAKGIRKLQKKDKILKERIKFLLGLVCGGVPGKGMIEYIAKDAGKSLPTIQKVIFRDKVAGEANRNCSVKLRLTTKEEIKSNFPNGAFGRSFLNKLFHYKGCNLCDDIFAEYADAAFMDAWLPEHAQDVYGTSICIVRNQDLEYILKTYFSDENIEKVDIDVAIKAQNTVGLIQRKKKQSYFKRTFYRKMGYITPPPLDYTCSFITKIKFFIRTIQEVLIQKRSYKYWRKYKQNEISFEVYKHSMMEFIKLIKTK